ncbi:putative prefoldin subunit 5, partial [Tilletiopsis washingtonensis]
MSSSSSSAQQPGVDVGDLSPQQLLDVRSQLQSELQHLTASYGQLRAAQLKFKGCLDALAALGPSAEGKETLVPLSASLYVPGRLRSTHTVIVDVGTGYFVEKDVESAATMYDGKVAALEANLQELQATILRKEDNLRVVRDVLTVKAQQQRMQLPQESGAGAAGA